MRSFLEESVTRDTESLEEGSRFTWMPVRPCTSDISSDVSIGTKSELESQRGSDIGGNGESARARESYVGSQSRELAEVPGIAPSTTSVVGKSAKTARVERVGVGSSEVTTGVRVAPWTRVGAEVGAGSAMVDGIGPAVSAVTEDSLDGGSFANGSVVTFGAASCSGK